MAIRLESPSTRREAEFLDAVHASRVLYRDLVAPPDTAEKFRTLMAVDRQATHASFLVVLAETDELVGVINVSNIVRGLFQSAYLGYYGFVPHTGKGLMREGLGQVVTRAFGDLRLHRLEANIQPGNQRSIDLVRSLGFRLEGFSPRYLKVCGRWRDHERWALLTEEWKGME